MIEATHAAREPNPLAHRVRRVSLLLHRYVGLVLALFLVVAGLTGSVVAFREELATLGAHVQQEQSLSYAPEHGAIVYRVKSSLDIQDRYPRTEVYLDAITGAPLGFDAPTPVCTSYYC